MKTPLEVYLEKIAHYKLEIKALKAIISRISWLRFAVIVGILLVEYLQFKGTLSIPFHVLTIILLLSFVLLVRKFQNLNFKLLVAKTYLYNLEKEADLIQNNRQHQFFSGAEFNNSNHAYAYDLDIFGDNSLYQYLNRASTYLGQQLFAKWLSDSSHAEVVLERQQAVSELATKGAIYQEILVYTQLGSDNSETSKHLAGWTQDVAQIPLVSRIISYLLPTLGLALTLLLWITGNDLYFKWATLVFIANVAHFNRFGKQVQAELGKLDKLSKTIRGYSQVLKLISQQQWESKRLKALQSKLQTNGITADKAVNQLAAIIESLESVQNGFAMAFFNGTVQFHLHTYQRLLTWKKAHAQQLHIWIDVIAEMEALISLANFKHNNPTTVFPELNDQHEIAFENLAHPLLNPSYRISNSIDFSLQPFTILTGSNMSGKSTFLRTVGIGIVLANAGGPVCASKACFTPIALAVSMHLTDSLTESTSYFYAEVKRLEFILNELKKGPLFVLLDEILRGTNSDDKKAGTIGVIENLIQHEVYGMIATHDLEVCDTASSYPKKLINRCFEVDFIGDELHFDYTLRDGICKNKSATFIMKKHGVID